MKCKHCGKECEKTDWGYVCHECKKGYRVDQCKTEVYSRVVGFYRPVQQWNAGKQEEWKDRREFVLR